MQCPLCNLEQPSGNRFCEDCGAKMDGRAAVVAVAPVVTASMSCPQCGTISNGSDGYCLRCGHERKSLIENHLEVSVSPHLAGVSDRGKVRARNEDCVAVTDEAGAQILVVCDGVSQSQQADRAALAAAKYVRDGLLKSDITSAFSTAEIAVRAIPCDASHPGDPAETTIVAAIRRGNAITIGWLGDSRAYWIDAMGMRQLTIDHSWVNQMVASGDLTFDQAVHHPNAHAITRTLGGPSYESAGDEASVIHLEMGREVNRPGWLMLCTDGFWDSHEDAEQLAAFVMDRVHRHAANADALSLARDLVENAVQNRGHDNTTVGLLFVGAGHS